MTYEDIPYSSGHPWYYVLGGHIPSIKEIRLEVRATAYKGYLAGEISKAFGNDAKLRSIKDDVEAALKKDISQYRQCAFQLYQYRKTAKESEPVCDAVHVSVSLKRNHIYNELAHLDYINELTPQLSLF